MTRRAMKGRYLSSCCSPSPSSIVSSLCGASSSGVHSRRPKPPTIPKPRSRSGCRRTSCTTPALVSAICFPSAAPCWASELRKSTGKETRGWERSELGSKQTRTFGSGGRESLHGSAAGQVLDLAPEELAVLHQVLHLPLQGSDALLLALQHALQLGDGQQHPRREAVHVGGSWGEERSETAVRARSPLEPEASLTGHGAAGGVVLKGVGRARRLTALPLDDAKLVLLLLQPGRGGEPLFAPR